MLPSPPAAATSHRRSRLRSVSAVISRVREWLSSARTPVPVAKTVVGAGRRFEPRGAFVDGEAGAGRRVLDRQAVRALTAGRQADERLAGEQAPVRRFTGPDVQPRSAQAPWRFHFDTTQPPARSEVGSRRRRLDSVPQPRPDLRVINGEGTGPASGRRARLRSVDEQGS